MVLNKPIDREALTNQFRANKAVDSIQDNFADIGEVLRCCHAILNMAPDIERAKDPVKCKDDWEATKKGAYSILENTQRVAK